MENTDRLLEKAFLAGKYVYLRPPERRDVEGRWYQWFNDPEVTRYLKRGTFPNTYEEQILFYENMGKNRDELILAIVDKASHQHIGVISLRPIDWIHRTADIAIVIGEKDYWSGFHAIEAMALLTDHSFCRLNLHKIRAYQHEKLGGWRKYLELIGYRTEAVLKREVFSEGRYHDMVVLAMFQEDCLRLKQERQGHLLGISMEDMIREFVMVQGISR